MTPSSIARDFLDISKLGESLATPGDEVPSAGTPQVGDTVAGGTSDIRCSSCNKPMPNRGPSAQQWCSDACYGARPNMIECASCHRIVVAESEHCANCVPVSLL